MTAEQKAIKNALSNQTIAIPDEVKFKRDGTVEVRRYYFYHFDMDAPKWGEKVLQALAANGIRFASVTTHDNFTNNGDSYFSAIVTPQ